MAERAITIRIRQKDYDLLDRELKAIAPTRRLGFPKAVLLEGFCKALVIALHRPNHFSLGEMLLRMYLAAIPPDDTEGQEQIHNLFR